VCMTDGVVQAVVGDVATVAAEFVGVRPVASGGTIYPGLIELHNHLPYDILRLWQVPQKFSNRDQWRADTVPDYCKLISGPMGVLGRSDAVPAIVRYAEAKCLVAGTTTSQGVTLMAAPGISGKFRGVATRRARATGCQRPPPTWRTSLRATPPRFSPGSARRPACCCTSRKHRQLRSRALRRASGRPGRVGDPPLAGRHPLRGAAGRRPRHAGRPRRRDGAIPGCCGRA
jgi:hypothetical protein